MADPSGARRSGDRLGEFEIIETYFAPLARDRAGALGLVDDAGLFAVPNGCDGVITTDAMVAGVHYLASDAPDGVGWKLLAVNLSDLAAMGAEPVGYTLDLALADDWDTDWLAGFARGLELCQDRYGTALLGGDTVAARGPTVAAVTAIGALPTGTALTRSGARAGDSIWVSGTVGDAALALAVRTGATAAPPGADGATLEARLDRPEPRLALGRALRGLATAAIDVSDGLTADLAHICTASAVGAEIDAAALPLSSAARALVERDARLLSTVLTGGDDYELLFAAPADAEEAIRAAAAQAATPVSRIGALGATPGVRVVDRDGGEIPLARAGYTHF